ncbi:hypothetical protein HDU97_006609 [Phlyctochytrium planicorne]|nr:hypothetical protein HDU97_006609 [Phlyctochytrium planicorne]
MEQPARPRTAAGWAFESAEVQKSAMDPLQPIKPVEWASYSVHAKPTLISIISITIFSIMVLIPSPASAFGTNCPFDSSPLLVHSIQTTLQNTRSHQYGRNTIHPPAAIYNQQQQSINGDPNFFKPETRLPSVPPIPLLLPSDSPEEIKSKQAYIDSISNLRIAFVGDHGLTKDTARVFRLIKRWSLDGVMAPEPSLPDDADDSIFDGDSDGNALSVFIGDFDYKDDPGAFFEMIESELDGSNQKCSPSTESDDDSEEGDDGDDNDGDEDYDNLQSSDFPLQPLKKARKGGLKNLLDAHVELTTPSDSNQQIIIDSYPDTLSVASTSKDKELSSSFSESLKKKKKKKKKRKKKKKKKKCPVPPAPPKEPSIVPVLGVVGNHDILKWYTQDGYRDRFVDRLKKNKDADCVGEFGVNMVFVLSGIGTLGSQHIPFLLSVLPNYAHVPLKFCIFHKNQHLYQTGDKNDETGYEIYDVCREHGFVVVTAHEHSYERTKAMKAFEGSILGENGMVTETRLGRGKGQRGGDGDDVLKLFPGQSFAFVSGLGGDSIRSWKDGLEKKPWWAATAALDNGVNYGALLCTIQPASAVATANCTFYDVAGEVWDRFTIDATKNHDGLSTTTKTPEPRLTQRRGRVELPIRSTFDILTVSFRENLPPSFECGKPELAFVKRPVASPSPHRILHLLHFRGDELGRKNGSTVLEVLGVRHDDDVDGFGKVRIGELKVWSGSVPAGLERLCGADEDLLAQAVDGVLAGEARIWERPGEGFEGGEVWGINVDIDRLSLAGEKEALVAVEGWVKEVADVEEGEAIGIWGGSGEAGMCVVPSLVIL